MSRPDPIWKPLQNLTLVKAAVYLFMIALSAKGIALYATHHPMKDDLISVSGIVKKVRLGGEGKSTYFRIESGNGTNRYSSYYGKVWPGMERIKSGDMLSLLTERNKLYKNEFISGKQYYIWELIHQKQVIMNYEDVRMMVQDIEATEHRYINGFSAASAILLFVATIRKFYLGMKKNNES
jgi:hypothetical protein